MDTVDKADQHSIMEDRPSGQAARDEEIQLLLLDQSVSMETQSLRFFLDNTSDLVVEWDVEGNIRYANLAFCSFFSIQKSRLVGRPVREWILQDPSRQGSTCREGMFSKDACVVTEKYETEGITRWVLWHVQALWDSDGTVRARAALGKNITDAKNREHLLEWALSDCRRKQDEASADLRRTREQAATWQNLFEQHSAMKCLIDPDTATIVDANAAACRFFDLSKEDFRKAPQPWFLDVDAERLRQGLRDADEGKRNRFIGSRICRDGKVRTIEAWVSPLGVGEKILLYAIAFDITERIAQERIIAEKNIALEKQNRVLAEKNIAIREIAEQIEQSKSSALNAVNDVVERSVLPIADRLRAIAESGEAKRLADALEKTLRDILSSFDLQKADTLDGLSGRELEICNLIRSGMSSKEIAKILRISHRSVENHRHSIRRKLGFERQTNLSSFLSNHGKH